MGMTQPQTQSAEDAFNAAARDLSLAEADACTRNFFRAVSFGDFALAEAMIQAGQVPSLPHPDTKEHPLARAVNASDIRAARFLIRHGVCPARHDERHNDSLLRLLFSTGTTFATAEKVEDLAVLLIDHGAQVETKFASVVYDCLRRGFSRALGRVAATGADINVVAKSVGCTPLTWAINEKCDDSLIRALLDLGADPDGRRAESGSPLLRAIEKKNHAAIALLLEKGANPEKTASGNYPLHAAAGWEDRIAFKMLLDAGGGIDTADAAGRTALHLALAADSVNLDFLQWMIAQGACVNARGGTHVGRGHSLFAALKNGKAKLETISILLAADADPLLTDTNGETAADFARRAYGEESPVAQRLLLAQEAARVLASPSRPSPAPRRGR
jgi:ankyrin repeat protein